MIIVAKIDRAFRSSLDALKTIRAFRQRDIHLYLLDLGGEVTEEGIGGLIITVLSAVAEFERELISERSRAAIAHLRSQGRVYGTIPWGFTATADKRLVPHPRLAEALELMERQYVAGVPLGDFDNEVACTTGVKIPPIERVLDVISRDQPNARQQLIRQRRTAARARMSRTARRAPAARMAEPVPAPPTAKHPQGQSRWTGGSRPWGFTATTDNRLVPHPRLAEAVQLMRRHFIAGIALKDIASEVLRITGLKIPTYLIFDVINLRNGGRS